MQLDKPIATPKTWAFTVSVPQLDGWHDYTGELTLAQPTTWGAIAPVIHKNLARALDLPPTYTWRVHQQDSANKSPKTTRTNAPRYEPIDGAASVGGASLPSGVHLVLALHPKVNLPPQAPPPSSHLRPLATAPEPPEPTRLAPPPEPPERNLSLQLVSALVPLLAACAFAIFMNNPWFLLLSASAPITVGITSRVQRRRHETKVREIHQKNIIAVTRAAEELETYVTSLVAHPATAGGSVPVGRATRNYAAAWHSDVTSAIAPHSGPDRESTNSMSQVLRHYCGVVSLPVSLSQRRSTAVHLPLLTPAKPPTRSGLFAHDTATHTVAADIRLLGALPQCREHAAALLQQLLTVHAAAHLVAQCESAASRAASWLLAPIDALPEIDAGTINVQVTESQTGVDISVRTSGVAAVEIPLHEITVGASRAIYRTSAHSTTGGEFLIRPDEPYAWAGLGAREWETWLRQTVRPLVLARQRAAAVTLDQLHAAEIPWARQPVTGQDSREGGHSQLGALVGILADATDATPVRLQLVADGPHIFVAGTTGSGKSELLRSLIVSMCFYSSPSEVQFVLLDFKGGAGFAALEHLPHVASVVTNLDGLSATRVMSCLLAEVNRRQRIFHAGNFDDIESYNAAVPASHQMPRLVVVVDEFRALLDSHPETRAGFVQVAALGRSLGIHLVLATQRPGGSLTPDLAANVGARICLRVADRNESLETIGVPDAADISEQTPGVALVSRSVGQADPLRVQSLMVSTRLEPTSVTHKSSKFGHAAGPESGVEPALPVTEPGAAPVLLVKCLRTGTVVVSAAVVTASEGARAGSFVEPLPQRLVDAAANWILPPSPLLPPLPFQVSLEALEDHRSRTTARCAAVELDAAARETVAGGAELENAVWDSAATENWQANFAKFGLPVAVVDDVARQRFSIFHWLPLGGLTAVVGAPRSGRTNCLTALQHGPYQRVLVLECATRAATTNAGITARWAVGSEAQGPMLTDIDAVQGALRDLLQAQNRSAGHCLLVVDDVDVFQARVAALPYSAPNIGLLQEVVSTLQQSFTAAPDGVHVVISGGRRLIAHGVTASATQLILLTPAEPHDYTALGADRSVVQQLRAPGRCALRVADGSFVLGQWVHIDMATAQIAPSVDVKPRLANSSDCVRNSVGSKQVPEYEHGKQN